MKKIPALSFIIIVLVIFSGCKKDIPEESLTVTDFDGNVYKAVRIGTQVWMAENLRVTRYNNGDSVAKVTNQSVWQGANTGSYCIYNNADSNAKTYGNLYNWFAVNDSRKLAPAGWHIPTEDEWFKLQYSIGDYTIAGGKMKKTGTDYWMPPNSGADDNSGFAGLPAGRRDASSGFTGMRYMAFWWSITETPNNPPYAFYRRLVNDSPIISWSNIFKTEGLSVRCVKD